MWPPPPTELPVRLHAALPDALRRPVRSAWADANRGGAAIHSFLEGPCLDAAGRLHVVDIPHGRVLRVEDWATVAEYGGWPNGMALAPDGAFVIADYRRGLLRLDPATGTPVPVLETVLSESFKGLNDVIVHPDGSILFTDQGQTGLHDPSGRVWRLHPDGRLDRLIANGPSPNGLALNRDATALYVAMTRSCEVWRFVLRRDAVVGKANLFHRIPAGTSGPDGMAVDAADRLWIANPGHGLVWGVDPHGIALFRLDCTPWGRMPTNCCLSADGRTLMITESDSGSILAAMLP
ncbi:SMP-30/gluconolactonase/LRE family protein [Roseomonas sp. CCTCC AB2023176]|uniref:SMP-30/gluconolactonase/LRE family protein n=1 Tax=Roseomonas sp. CCTCC AB2023176 TaxID=3342640 RepID=UPI0035DA8A7F